MVLDTPCEDRLRVVLLGNRHGENRLAVASVNRGDGDHCRSRGQECHFSVLIHRGNLGVAACEGYLV